MIIGLDDTDSVDGMCTTYLCALLCEKLGVKGFPRLIRLNPNIPYKTRGNGAVSFEVSGDPVKIKKTVFSFIKKYARLDDENTNPGVVFAENLSADQKRTLSDFYLRAVSELVEIKDAEEAAKKAGVEYKKFKLGRGLIGALAAVGAELPDRTYEFIAYRAEKNYGKEKKIEKNSVFEMDEATFPGTFNNVDSEAKKVLITPHGYDPVLCGIRGNDPEVVRRAWGMLRVGEEVERTLVFETNHGTDAHLRKKKISEIRPFDCVILEGEVVMAPQTIEGGHVLFAFSDGTGKIACAAYEPTGGFRDVVRKLFAGDHVVVCGGIGQHPNTLNLERLQVVSLSESFASVPPVCCGKNMSSAGSGSGFKCKKCGGKAPAEAAEKRKLVRDISPGMYWVDVGAMRHLAKPQSRFQAAGGGRFKSLKSKLSKVMRRGSPER